jgi:hypothetical protein
MDSTSMAAISSLTTRAVKGVLVAGLLGIASIGAAWGLTSTPATAAPAVQNTHLLGVVPRDHIEANIRSFKWPRIDRLETKLGSVSSFLAIHETKVVEQNVYPPGKSVWLVLIAGDVGPGRGVGTPTGATLPRATWMVIAYDAGTGLAIASRSGGGPEPSGWRRPVDGASEDRR